MVIKFNVADESESFWWLKDDKNLVHRFFFSIYKCTEEGKTDAIYGIVAGPFHLRFYFPTNNH